MIKNLSVMQEAGGRPFGWDNPREGSPDPLQCSCLENPMDRGAWQAPAHRGAYEWDTTEATQHACTPTEDVPDTGLSDRFSPWCPKGWELLLYIALITG